MTKELEFLNSNNPQISIVYNMKQQEKIEFKYIKFVEFKNLQSWDPKKYIKKENNLQGQVLFEKILSKRDIKWVKIEKGLEYPILGVRAYGNGVYLNRVSKGKDLKMKKYQIVEENDLFWCKVDTKNGAFGVVKSDLAGSFGSTNMNVAKIDIQKIFPEYLQLLFSLPRFQQYLDSFITGTTNRKYISFDRLLNEVYLPLPTLEIQKQLVENYQNKITQAENNKVKISELEKQIETYLMDELGIEIVEKEKRNSPLEGWQSQTDGVFKYLQFVEFKELDRWGVDFNIKGSSKKYKFKPVPLKDIAKVNMGASPNSDSLNNLTGLPFLGGAVELDFENQKFNISRFCNDISKINKINDIIFCVRATIGKPIFADKIYSLGRGVCSITPEKVNPRFLFHYLITQINYLQSIGTGSTFKQITKNDLESLQIPLPPLEIQQEIVAQIDIWKAEIKELKQTAESLEKEAKEGFEGGVFNTI